MLERRFVSGGALAAAVLIVAVPLVGCGDSEELDFCTAHAAMLEQQAAMDALDPNTLTAEDAAKVADDYLVAVRQLLTVADGRYYTSILRLEVAVNDVLLTLESVDDQADYSTWQPLVEDDLKAAADAAAQLDAAVGPSCEVGS